MSDMYADHVWFATHPGETGKYIGKWVAVLNRKIIASANTLKKLVEKVGEPKIRETLIARVPTKQEMIGVY